ncbi:hypothetical protein [Puniceicoccus vermicola]|uniref:Verru_Chthon cassette protein A n=1 Tax=Puniceicoccus vermicola TaxID=388746 RepID=A0A7X1E327_9BACT|nr:hypothetical protein [Puniceicoccus vermicola]MBC2600651.1 hypothetical protein [Puniceicoccus vermicola]
MKRRILQTSTLSDERASFADQSGFALIISLGMLSLVLLLLVVLSSQLQIHLSEASISSSTIKAKESAKLGFLVALGELQKSAGPDQRVTARSDIFYSDQSNIPFPNETAAENRFWTGVWDTTRENQYESSSLSPTWLVSGDTPTPSSATTSRDILLMPGYLPAGTTDYSDPGAFYPVRVEPEIMDSEGIRFAWWIGDEGTKASIAIQDELIEEVSKLPPNGTYLDYGRYSNRILRQDHNPTFSYPLLYQYSTATSEELEAIDKQLGRETILRAADLLTDNEKEILSAHALHDLTTSNRFVLSNPIEGGLKKDLSYLKTVNPETISESDIFNHFGKTANPLTPQVVNFFQTQSDPSLTQAVKGQALIIPQSKLAETRALTSRFTFAPIITEFQLSCGVAAAGGNLANTTSQPSDLYLIYKVYLDIWNPFTAPMRLGDPIAAAEPNSSDIRITVEGLPTAKIENKNTADIVTTPLPDISILWSELQSGKTLKPGMNFHLTFPTDTGGDNSTGAIQQALVFPVTKAPVQLNGSRSDDYTGRFSFGSDPIQVTFTAIDGNGNESEFCRATLRNYPNFTIDYKYNSYTNRSSWFKRVVTSEDGAWGMNNESLEVNGYVFGFRFRLLDEQESIGDSNDLSRILSETDIRNQVIDVDLNTWDIGDAWSGEDAVPYDFTSSYQEVDPGYFEPSYGFKSDEFFYYGGSGRQDRIARVYEIPISGISSISELRLIEFDGYASNAVGNPWGDDLNQFFDAFFLSNLPDPSTAMWDGDSPLRNPRIKQHNGTPSLIDPNTAENLLLHNGFNLNSTSPEAWTAAITGRSFESGTFNFRYESPDSANWADDPPWGTLNQPLQNVIFSYAQSAPFNSIERPDNPRYELLTLDTQDDYPSAFSTKSRELNTDRQHPAFIQGLREMKDDDLEDLGIEVVEALRRFAATQNRPPLSMAEFLNEGILQEAIDQVPTINDRENGYDRIPRYSPASINQGSLISQIGEYSQVRSDTFTVRSYGANISHDRSGENAFYCEAIVQREIEEIDDNGGPFGRKFKILSFHWIPKPAEKL